MSNEGNQTFADVDAQGNIVSEQTGSLFDTVTDAVEPTPPKIFLYGVEGIGKSSWAASAQRCGLKPIIIPTEDGVKQIKCPKFPLAKSMQDVVNRLDALLNEEHPYDMVIIDTADWLERLIQKEACMQHGVSTLADVGYGKGYARAETLWEDFIWRFDKLIARKIGVVLLAHAGIQKIEDPDESSYDNYAPKLHTNSKGQGIMQTFCEWADCLLFCKYERHMAKEESGFGKERNVSTGLGRRMLYTTKHASFNAKNRFGLPSEIEMGDGKQADFGIFWRELWNSPVFK